MRIYLIGLMGAGKTTIGAALSSETGSTFHDTDVLIHQRNGLSIEKLFAVKGEKFFRSEEMRVIHELVGDRTVISCGGGLPFYNDLMNYLLSKGRVVYLYATPELLSQRIRDETEVRPLLNTGEAAEKVLARQFAERDPVYRKAHLVVDVSGKSVTEIVAEITAKIS